MPDMFVIMLILFASIVFVIWRGLAKDDLHSNLSRQSAVSEKPHEQTPLALSRLTLAEFGEELTRTDSDRVMDSVAGNDTYTDPDSATVTKQVEQPSRSLPERQTDRENERGHVSETVCDSAIEPAAEPTLASHLQQIEATESQLYDSIFRDLQEQLGATVAVLREVEQYVVAMQALEPFQQQWQQLQYAQAQAAIPVAPEGTASASAQNDYDI